VYDGEDEDESDKMRVTDGDGPPESGRRNGGSLFTNQAPKQDPGRAFCFLFLALVCSSIHLTRFMLAW
jgi:hypothetical protein